MADKAQPKTGKLTLIHGDKGGTGKSFVASIYLDKFLADGTAGNVIAVESDTRTPDVFRRFRNHLTVVQIDLKDKSGWMDLAGMMEDQPDKEFVANLPAGIGEFFASDGDYIVEVLSALGRGLKIYWPINRLADGLISLKQFLGTPLADYAMKENGGICIIKNGFFGPENKFSRWEGSKARKELSSRPEFREVFLHELHERLVDSVTSPFTPALENGQLKIAEKAELQRWLRVAHTAIWQDDLKTEGI